MILIFFTGCGLLYLDALDHNSTIDAEKMRTDVIPHLQQAWNQYWLAKSELEQNAIVQCSDHALKAGEDVISENHLARLPKLPLFENLADSDRLMLPIRTSMFSQPAIETRVPNHDGSSDDEENADNYQAAAPLD